MKTYLVLDIGGSSIKYALIQENRTILKKAQKKTPLDTLPHFIETIGELYDRYAESIAGIAISMPGSIDPKRGYSYHGGALPYLNNVETRQLLMERCPLPITIGNDAKCAAMAEIGFGCLKDVDNAITLVLGTGVGGCLIYQREVIMGSHFFAGEFSFIKTDSQHPEKREGHWCYQNGSTGLLARVQQELQSDEFFDGRQIFALCEQGDELACRALDLFTKDLSVQIFNLQVIFDPERFAIGGGISEQPLLYHYLQKNIDALVSKLSIPAPIIVPCQYYNDANLLGALYQHLSNEKLT